MEATEQRIQAALGALLLAFCLASQSMVLLYLAPKFRAVFAEMELRHASGLIWVAAWRWPLLLGLLAGQAAAAVATIRRQPWGTRLLVIGGVAFVLTVSLTFLFGSTTVYLVSSLTSSLR